MRRGPRTATRCNCPSAATSVRGRRPKAHPSVSLSLANRIIPSISSRRFRPRAPSPLPADSGPQQPESRSFTGGHPGDGRFARSLLDPPRPEGCPHRRPRNLLAPATCPNAIGEPRRRGSRFPPHSAFPVRAPRCRIRPAPAPAPRPRRNSWPAPPTSRPPALPLQQPLHIGAIRSRSEQRSPP